MGYKVGVDYEKGTYETKLREQGIDPNKYLGTAGFGDNINPTEYQTILGKENIYNTINNPAPQPDFLNLDVARQNIYDEVGVTTARKEYQDIISRLNQFDTDTENTIAQIGQQKLSMNVYRGQQQKISEDRSLERGAISREAVVKQAALASLTEEANARFQLVKENASFYREIITSNPGAGILPGDSLIAIDSKLANYQNKQLIKELQIKYPQLSSTIDESMDFNTALAAIGKGLDKQDLKDAYNEIFGESSKKLSSSEMKKAIQAHFKEEKEDADRKRALEMERLRLTNKNLDEGGGGGGGFNIEWDDYKPESDSSSDSGISSAYNY